MVFLLFLLDLPSSLGSSSVGRGSGEGRIQALEDRLLRLEKIMAADRNWVEPSSDLLLVPAYDPTDKSIALSASPSRALPEAASPTRRDISIMFCHVRKAGGTTISKYLMTLDYVNRSIASHCPLYEAEKYRKGCHIGTPNQHSKALFEQPITDTFRYNEIE